MVVNKGKKDLILKWMEPGQAKKANAPKMANTTQKVMVQSRKQPDAIKFQVFNAVTNELVKVGENQDKESFEVLPTLDETDAILEIKGKLEQVGLILTILIQIQNGP